ncbi:MULTISPECIES: SDR family oxidoreductase [Pectobacteriaceae]|uniref:SDR family oxidoreductase n=3 Tax=Pectobacteriaceae TaxID=1903410 RepID=A0A5J5FPX7_9GAMM|nr:MULTISPECIES: SDR family oxidoreductase [Pectobacteriaceae]MEE3651930.1 SDR family oxidoreductase [Brenneria sp. HEZEL_4_2_4]MEE3663724.1 SDR family oxidoreductase [Brenneria sp. g21c3]KAA8994698.1 SDR family oxidoreductase [Affinibrenneria salicis]MDX5628664.1 SDR family oxidoreductase [Brenneria sp. L3-3Z]MDX5695803.1 SDR family oxidoreductase [Brenneria sp. L4-2C]
MNIFLTGATGFIGLAITTELIRAGHRVTGLARSDKGEQLLARVGAETHRGALENIQSLVDGAQKADAVIHCAYDNTFSHPEEMVKKETQAIKALGRGLQGSTRPLIITSVAAMGCAAPGQLATEDFYDPATRNPRKSTELAGARVADNGVNVSIVRLPQVHNECKQGFVTSLISLAREKGVSAYVGEGTNQWAAAHLLDVATLYRLVVEQPQSGLRYHAVAEEGIPLRDIAEAISVGLDVPLASLSSEAANAHFGWLAMFAQMDMRASSALTRKRLDWHPAHPELLQDIERYFSL